MESFPEKRTLNIPADLHRELKIASAHRGEEIQQIIRKAWECFKKSEGKKLHDPVPPSSTD